MNAFSDIHQLREAFENHQLNVQLGDVIAVGHTMYVADPMQLTESGEPVITLRSDKSFIALQWGRQNVSFFPRSVTEIPVFAENAIVESIDPEIEAPACELLEHYATIGGARLQMKYDAVERPTLFISKSDINIPDDGSNLPAVAKVNLGETTVFAYVENGEMIIPSLCLESLDGRTIYDVRATIEDNKCTHLVLPDPRS